MSAGTRGTQSGTHAGTQVPRRVPGTLLLENLERGHPHHGSVNGVERCGTCMGTFHQRMEMLAGMDRRLPPPWIPVATGGALVDAVTAGR